MTKAPFPIGNGAGSGQLQIVIAVELRGMGNGRQLAHLGALGVVEAVEGADKIG